ncbi:MULTISPECIES: TPM domain-containing protein [Arenibacter]|uniref:TPM domain-containing protein n=1 Tax=Arenibacter TaxID=178469 RepID=UPI000A3BAC43|nr:MULTISPECIES: TPM domain-containing protein [Arenibacter]
MPSSEDFLTIEEEREIIEAIRIAENNTSGEIRVHIENGCGKDPLERAKEVFHLLKMDNTKQDNGVLIYVATKEHTFAICGGKGIDKVVPKNFWDATKNTIISHFKAKRFKQGLIEGILLAGKELKAHFPWREDNKNELSDEISRG